MLRCLPKILWACGIVMFAFFAWLGYLLGARPAPPVPPPVLPPPPDKITLNFYGYDIDGKPVQARDQFKAHLSDPASQKAYQSTQKAGDSKPLAFTPDAEDRYKTWSEQVTWPTRQQYLAWLDRKEAELKRSASHNAREFWHRKFDGFRKDADPKDKKSFDYPVIFEKVEKKH